MPSLQVMALVFWAVRVMRHSTHPPTDSTQSSAYCYLA